MRKTLTKATLSVALLSLFTLGSCSSFSTTGYSTDRAYDSPVGYFSTLGQSLWIDAGHIWATVNRHFLNYRPNRY